MAEGPLRRGQAQRAAGRDREHLRPLEWFRSRSVRGRHGLAHRRNSQRREIRLRRGIVSGPGSYAGITAVEVSSETFHLIARVHFGITNALWHRILWKPLAFRNLLG